MEADWTFDAVVWEWRGPAPYYFASVPEDVADALTELAPVLTYGWGVIPVTVTIGRTTWTTSLFPRDGGYAVPLKAAIRAAESIGVDDMVQLDLRVTW